jgi:hypothetical protein
MIASENINSILFIESNDGQELVPLGFATQQQLDVVRLNSLLLDWVRHYMIYAWIRIYEVTRCSPYCMTAMLVPGMPHTKSQVASVGWITGVYLWSK